MHDLSSQPLDDDPRDQRSLEPTDGMALVPQESADYRRELYARLRTIIDSATESIRALKEENAALTAQNTEMAGQVDTLEQRIRAVTTGLASDESALRKSAEALEQILHGAPTAMTNTETPSASEDAAPSAVMEAPPIAESEIDAEPEAEAMPETATEPAIPSSMEETGPIPEADQSAPITSDANDEHERVVAPRLGSATDGTYTLIAYPFVRFSDLGQFQAALQKLTGVHDAQVRRFAQGTLEMRIGYSGTADLATALRTLATEIEDVSEEEPYQLRVRLRTSQST